MANRKITQDEQSCISNCINRHWGDPDSKVEPEKRDREYEQCLEDCRICA